MGSWIRVLVSFLFALSIGLGSTIIPVAATPWQDKVDPWVLEMAGEGETEFLVFLVEQADLSGAAALQTKEEKGAFVYHRLSEVAAHTQPTILRELDRLGVAYQSYWVANMIWVRAGLRTVQTLAMRPEVAYLYANPRVRLEDPVEQAPAEALSDAVEWNIALVGAPQVWALGYTGQGVVIGGADTGYDWTHPALINQYRGWDGSAADHDYNWSDATASPSPTPIDPYGHGTHTMGTMVGDDGAGNQIGMSPGARWIGCRNMDEAGYGSPATYAACYQWFIAPTRVDGSEPRPDLAPDVINNSWGCTDSEGCGGDYYNILLAVVQSVRAAGILTAHSAGNSGGAGCSSVDTPAAIYAESFTVGATNAGDSLAGFSSRGPVTRDYSNRLKPDIAAPGVNVRSCTPGGGYASWSGTSMAAPHVAGLVALLLSANPGLRGEVDEIENLIEQTALHIASTACSSNGVPNNLYGWGRIQAWQAILSVPHSLIIEKTASAEQVAPGQMITYTLTVTHFHSLSPTVNVVLTDTIPDGTQFVTASMPYTYTGGTVQWDFPSLYAWETRAVELVVQVDVTATGMITNADYGVSSDDVAWVSGEPVAVPIVPYTFNLYATAPDYLTPGNLLAYNFTISNNHPFSGVSGVVLTDALPIGTSFVSATGNYSVTLGVVRWDVGNLGAGESEAVQLVVYVPVELRGVVENSDYVLWSQVWTPYTGDPMVTHLRFLNGIPVVYK